ncbi:thioredoxin [Tsukamurella sp. 1534]|uniref:thioredoxin n=1 Tax=Tsukamurella sp. 1534 TaxID=1151061 RepID=UPI000301FC3C|nr:thioredoxin [Tsukamurella sp. 1534]
MADSATTATVTVTDATFKEQVLESSKPVLVDFWATWCGPCKVVAPVLEQIAQEHGDKLTVAKVEVDQNPTAPRDYQVLSIPTLILFQDGEPTTKLIGAKSKSAILKALDGVL